MFKNSHQFSVVTTVLPNSTTARVLPNLLVEPGSSALSWKARGTLLQDSWWQRWVPPISPAKSMTQLLVPDTEVSRLVSRIVEDGKLHQQATGAVYSTPCEHVYFGSQFSTWPQREGAAVLDGDHRLTENLSIIYCIVGHNLSDRVSRAAINAGAHGPIVYYSEGRGLRDRLGWLRITKEHEKEVLMVLADEANADEVFDAMARAGQLHLPGRGFMYRMAIDKGMFNLPARVSHHHYDANMQQIINAIDHLSGHTHWRDQAVFNVGGEGRGAGLENFTSSQTTLTDQVALSAMIKRPQAPALMDAMLDAGAPGLNITYARHVQANAETHQGSVGVSDEYGMLRCITDAQTSEVICATIDGQAESLGFKDMCMFVNSVPKVATYIPGNVDYRQPLEEAS